MRRARLRGIGGTIYLSFHAQAKEYAPTPEDQDSQTLEPSHTLESRNPGVTGSQYDNPAFNLVRLELEGAQELAAQLQAKAGVSGAPELLHQLRNQVCRWVKVLLFSPSSHSLPPYLVSDHRHFPKPLLSGEDA